MKIVTFGEIMLRLKSIQNERLFQSPLLEATFGGGEANVAVALSHLGLDTEFVTLLPKNTIGDSCKNTLRYHNVGTNFIKQTSNRLGIYFIEAGANQRPSKVVYDRADSAISKIDDDQLDWDNIFSDAAWFHVSGITPAISEGAALQAILAMKKAKKNNVTISCDLNFRKKLWKYGKSAQDIMPILARYADVLIGNEEDFQKSLGYENDSNVEGGELDKSSYLKMCEKIFNDYPNVKKIGITLRESFSANHNDWSALLATRDSAYFSKKYSIKDIVDRVGAGDSFSAGLIFGLSQNYSVQESLDYAVALSCLKHSIVGDFSLTTKDELIQLVNGNCTGRVQR